VRPRHSPPATHHERTRQPPGHAIGTSAPIAPEHIAGDPVDARTDLYAPGCVLYAMLTGAPPFTGDSPLGVVSQHLHRAPPSVRFSPGRRPSRTRQPDHRAARQAPGAPSGQRRPRPRPAPCRGWEAREPAATVSGATTPARWPTGRAPVVIATRPLPTTDQHELAAAAPMAASQPGNSTPHRASAAACATGSRRSTAGGASPIAPTSGKPPPGLRTISPTWTAAFPTTAGIHLVPRQRRQPGGFVRVNGAQMFATLGPVERFP
jgi:eukaryotic-like serine/threonine-protein kinase